MLTVEVPSPYPIETLEVASDILAVRLVSPVSVFLFKEKLYGGNLRRRYPKVYPYALALAKLYPKGLLYPKGQRYPLGLGQALAQLRVLGLSRIIWDLSCIVWSLFCLV